MLRTTTPGTSVSFAAVAGDLRTCSLTAKTSCAFSSPLSSRSRLINVSTICASSVILAMSASALRAMANTSADSTGNCLIQTLVFQLQRFLLLCAKVMRILLRGGDRAAGVPPAPHPGPGSKAWHAADPAHHFFAEMLALILRLRFPCIRIGELRGDPSFPRIQGVEDRLVKKTLQQPHQDEKVDDLRNNSEPVDQHKLFSGAAAIT